MVERVGFMRYEWRAYGELRRGVEMGSLFVCGGVSTTVGEGTAFTRWGAEWKVRRLLRLYCR